MSAHIIDGRHHAAQIKTHIAQEIARTGIAPCLAVILVGDNPASHIYVERKKQACLDVGMTSRIHHLPAASTRNDLLQTIHQLNGDSSVTGILLQLPLPPHLDSSDIIQSIDPAKDVDSLTDINMGKLVSGHPDIVPCTPQGVMALLQNRTPDLSGMHAVIIGRSLLLGKPMGQLLLQADCTITHCHSKTRDLPALTRQADIVIAATGQAKMVKADWIKNGAIVIDVGISRDTDGTISGDVDFDAVKHIASAITPVPGGVGPMTVACLLRNNLQIAIKKQAL